MIVNKIRADTDLASGVQAERLGRLFAESDQSAHLFEVHVMDGAHAVSLDGAAVTGYFIRPDDATVTIQGSASGNVAYLTLPASCYRYAGHFSLIIKVSANDVSTAIFWGDGMITRSTSDILLDPEQVVPSLDQLLAQIEAIKQATAQVNAVLPAAATAIDNANTATARANTAAAQAETDHDALEYIMGETMTSAARADTAAARAEDAAEAIEQEIVPQFTIGTVREVTSGNTAATITGTTQNPVLNLDLARGLDGDGSISTVNGYQPDSNKNVQIPVVSSGVSGLAPAPAAGDNEKYLRGDGTWHEVQASGGSFFENISVTEDGWSETAAGYFQKNITVQGLTGDAVFVLSFSADYLTGYTAETLKAARDAYALVFYAEASANMLYLQAISAPETGFYVSLKEV